MTRNPWCYLKSEKRNQRRVARESGFHWIILLGVEKIIKVVELHNLTSSVNTR